LHVTVWNVEGRKVEKELFATAGKFEQHEDYRICERG
jgi:hypothetical protein